MVNICRRVSFGSKVGSSLSRLFAIVELVCVHSIIPIILEHKKNCSFTSSHSPSWFTLVLFFFVICTTQRRELEGGTFHGRFSAVCCAFFKLSIFPHTKKKSLRPISFACDSSTIYLRRPTKGENFLFFRLSVFFSLLFFRLCQKNLTTKMGSERGRTKKT